MKVLNVSSRVYLQPDALDSAIAFYENLFNQTCRLRFSYSAAGLEIASIGHILLVAGSVENLEPFRKAHATFLVDNLDEFIFFLKQSGAQILSEPKEVPTGRNMHVRHPDGLVVEYVEHSQSKPTATEI